MTERRWTTRSVLLLTLLAGCVAVAVSARWLGWQALNATIRHKFPSVARIRILELAAWLGDAGRTPPQLLDVREPDEYRISHLADARQVEPGSDPTTLNLPKDQPIVTYCSVGYRSAEFARKLRAAGFTNVRNLEGSIFGWANESHPLVRSDEKLIGEVHPYNRLCGLLLRPERRAPVPPADAKGKD